MAWKEFILGFVTAILLGFIWKRTPLRLASYKIVNRADGAVTVARFRFYTKVFPKFGDLFRVIIDFLLFWFIFKWKNGIIVDFLAPKIGFAASWIWSKLYFITPFARLAAQDTNFRYCLIIYSMIAAFNFIFVCILFKDAGLEHGSEILIASLLVSMIVWYVFYGLCFLVVLIPIWFKVLSVLAAILSGIGVMILEIIILDL